MRLGRVAGGVLAALVAIAAMVSLGSPARGLLDGSTLRIFLTIASGVLWMCESLDLIREPFRPLVVLDLGRPEVARRSWAGPNA